MSWPISLGSSETPSVDLIIRRLAFHIRRRTLDPAMADHVLRSVNITRKTLSRYGCHQAPDGRNASDLHASGPRRLDLYSEICLALGENPGKVLWAATVAGDYESMLAVLNAELHVRQTLHLGGDLGLPDRATTVVISPSGLAPNRDDDRDPAPDRARV